MSSTPKKDIEYMHSTETRVALVEQALLTMTTMLHEIKSKVDKGREENKQEFSKLWHKVENLDQQIEQQYRHLDQRINDNYKYLDQKIDNRFENLDKKFLHLDNKININFKILVSAILGLYATAYGGIVAKFFNLI